MEFECVDSKLCTNVTAVKIGAGSTLVWNIESFQSILAFLTKLSSVTTNFCLIELLKHLRNSLHKSVFGSSPKHKKCCGKNTFRNSTELGRK